jgi:hypothetical protein
MNPVPRFTFEDTKPVVTDEQLLADIRRVATDLSSSSLPQRRYRQHGHYSTTAIKRRFGTWNAAIKAAGLNRASERDISEAELHQNLEEVWMRLGRQPRKREMAAPLSRFTHHPYVRRYGGWLKAVRAFLSAVEAESAAEGGEPRVPQQPSRGPRDPSLRLRFTVMRRDRFSCRHCGASPAKDPSVELHVDHVVPWAEGGSTALENLQTLCTRCNLGKSNLRESEGAG